jgi:ribosomal-protein-alanine N-acetyltransferase
MTTPDTTIRLLQLGDAEALTEHLTRDAKALSRWDPERPPEYYTLAGQRARVERMLTRHANGEIWPCVVLADGVVIGQVTVQDILRRAWRRGELGYWLGYPHHGQGHATRAVGLAVQLMAGELGLHRAEAKTQMDNLGSQHVLRNNGFLPCGFSRSHIFIAGRWRDEIIWERLLEE